MCDECKKKEKYKFNLCEECYGHMFEEIRYQNHAVEVIQKQHNERHDYYVRYALQEGSAFIQHNSIVTVQERFKLMDEYYKTGKITLYTPALFTGREEEEVISPVAIQFLPVEAAYIKTPSVICVPAIIQPRYVWNKSDFDAWCKEGREIDFDNTITAEEQLKAHVDLALRFGMNLRK